MRQLKAAIVTILVLGMASAWAATPTARIDVYGTGDQGILELEAKSDNLKGGRCSWLKEEGKVNRSWTLNTGKLGNEWEEISFTLKADTDMKASIAIRGTWYKTKEGEQVQTWTWYDGMTVEGATLVNGGFEEADAKGGAKGWRLGKFQDEAATVIEDAAKAKDGKKFLQASSHRGATQTISLKAGQPAKFTFYARGAE